MTNKPTGKVTQMLPIPAEWTEVKNGHRITYVWQAEGPPPGIGMQYEIIRADWKEQPDGSEVCVIYRAKLLGER